ncbi:MAG: DUF401 family protein [Nitrospirae bacterium]|nr:DUF401 family protein [Nitrospirota bacterium]
MPDILKVSVVFIVILILLRKKLNIGYVMLIASGVLALLYLMPPLSILFTIKAAFLDSVTIKLAIALTLIRSFELILRERDVLSDMMKASKALLLKKRAVMIAMPLLIGMLPSVGGAYFSAPMVDESTKGMKMSQEEKAFINYWFRHPWEYILPLYPGILLASAISNIELRNLIVANTAYAVFIVITGFFFVLFYDAFCNRFVNRTYSWICRKYISAYIKYCRRALHRSDNFCICLRFYRRFTISCSHLLCAHKRIFQSGYVGNI